MHPLPPLACALSVLLLAPVLLPAQEARPAAPAPRGPQLVAGEGDARKPLSLAEAEVRVLIDGPLARTTTTLTFRNDGNRVLEAELVFPLPEGATVSGYGLDVNGRMADGVAVEKQQARVSYEQEVHKGIDPGLLEHVSGNNFRTRIYPVPAHGARTVKVEYVSALADTADGPACTVPLDWGQRVGRLTLRIEAARATAAPIVNGENLGKWELTREQGRYVLEQTFKDVEVRGPLSVALPRVAEGTFVENLVTEPSPFDDPAAGRDAAPPDCYFLLLDRPAVPDRQPEVQKPRRIGVLWDASMSRAKADTTRELGLLRKVLSDAGDVDVDVVVFRDTVEAPTTFAVRGGNCDALLHGLAATPFDGGTRLSAVRMPHNYRQLAGAAAASPAAVPDYAYWLLFSDGISDLGGGTPPSAEVPAYAVSSDDRADHATLRGLAEPSGGAYFNLRQVSDEQAMASLGRTPFSLVSVTSDPESAAEIYPRGSHPVSGRVLLAGKLLKPEAKITLGYGYGGRATQSRTFTVRRDAAGPAGGGLLPVFWAQQKVAELSASPERNHDALLKVGREFNLATPATSLLVLETADQYVQHRIVPPKSRPDVYAQFQEKIEQFKAEQRRTREERVQHALAMWNERVQWWETKYEYPKDFRYVDRAAGGDEQHLFGSAGNVSAGGGGITTGRPAAAEAPPPVATAQPTTPPQRQAARRASSDHEEARSVDAPVFNLAPAGGGGGGAGGGRGASHFGPAGLPGEGKGSADAGIESKAAIAIKEWDPNTPYLAALKKAGPDEAYPVFLEQRKTFGASPAFFLDCADYFLRGGNRPIGLRVLTDVAELQLEDARLLRIVARRLEQLGEHGLAIDLFEKVLALRPEEPQSHRDLALALADRGDQLASDASLSAPDRQARALAEYRRALDLLNQVITGEWDRFDGIQVVALMEANRVLARARALAADFAGPLDPRFVKLLDPDVRVVMTWDTDNTDIDLWVTEPSGEKCFYGHNRTTIGGLLSRDFTDGYGPEEYCLRKLVPGRYKIQANFYGSRQQSLVGPTTVQATVITHFGRPDERRQSLTLRLTEQKEVVAVGTVTLGETGGDEMNK